MATRVHETDASKFPEVVVGDRPHSRAEYLKLRSGLWVIRVQGLPFPKPGDVLSVATKKGHSNFETVADVIWSGTLSEVPLALATCKPKSRDFALWAFGAMKPSPEPPAAWAPCGGIGCSKRNGGCSKCKGKGGRAPKSPSRFIKNKPGDRWRHQTWPAGTPDAVVGAVDHQTVVWSERGGCTAQTHSLRKLTPAHGWIKVSAPRNGVPDVFGSMVLGASATLAGLTVRRSSLLGFDVGEHRGLGAEEAAKLVGAQT